MSTIERDMTKTRLITQTLANGNVYKVTVYGDASWSRTYPLYIYIRNLSGNAVLCSSNSTIVEGADGVLKIASYETRLFVAEPDKNDIYLSGNGSCDINISTEPINFNGAPASAYARAVASGYTGTPEQFDTALAGIDNLGTSISELTERDNLPYGRSLNDVRNIVSFYFDDAPVTDYTIIKPIADAQGIPITIGVITSAVGGGGQMTLAQLLELQSAGWEIQSHTHNHLRLDTMTEAEQDYQMKTSKEYLVANGINVKSVMYPQGYYNATTMKVARKYYRSGISSSQLYNSTPIKTYEIRRIILDDYDITQLEAKVDAMSNQWCIFYSHSNGWAQTQIDKLNALIDYVQSKPIDIMTCNQALDVFENKLDIGDSSNYFKIGADGKLDSVPFNNFIFAGNLSGIKNDTPITSFKQGSVTAAAFNISELSGIPISDGAGTLITYRLHATDIISFQTFLPYNSNKIYSRNWSGSAWGAWATAIPLRSYQSLDFGTINANSNAVFSVPIVGLKYGNVIVNFELEQVAGIICVATPSTDSLKLRLYNVTGSNITVGSKAFYVTQTQ